MWVRREGERVGLVALAPATVEHSVHIEEAFTSPLNVLGQSSRPGATSGRSHRTGPSRLTFCLARPERRLASASSTDDVDR